MTPSPSASSPIVVVTGANGLVGAQVCAALAERGAAVRGIVRRAGTAPDLPGLEERVGDFADPAFAAEALAGADAAVTTVHPLGSATEVQRSVGIDGTAAFARAARDAGVSRLVHVSTAAVYDRSPERGDVDEASPLVADDADAYGVAKRDADAALAAIDGITRVLVRPPAVLGAGESSVWNTVRPAGVLANEEYRHAVPQQSLAWVHVVDLAAFIADIASGRVPTAADPGDGPIEGGCTPVNVGTGSEPWREYFETVTGALGVEPVWDEKPAWTGQYLAGRARSWGWAPTVDLAEALAEIDAGLRAAG